LITFVCIAAVMVAAALAWVLVPLLARSRPEGVAREASNAAILRDQQRELDADLAADVITREQYDEAKRELERRVLDDSKVIVATRAPPTQVAAWTAAILGSAIPIVALILYVALGNHDAFAPEAARSADGAAQHEVTPEQVQAMAAKLAAKLEREPNNPEGWVMLARTYYAMNRHADAAQAFERAITLVPDNADLLADYADSIGAAQGGLNGKPLDIINRALKADPTHWKALALAGTAAFDRKDYAQAVAYWERMKATVPPGSSLSGSIDASIAEARELGGLKAALASGAGAAPAGGSANVPPTASPARPAPSVAAASSAPSATSVAAGESIAGTVELAPSLAARATPTDTVFIFARAAEGSKMPLAILRKQVKDLPMQFTLDDSLAMTPAMALSKFPTVVVGARVSKSGNATPQPGDLEGFSTVVKTGAKGVVVIIDRALP
jgi:cytochrome c-type biogenesis protein CcmH